MGSPDNRVIYASGGIDYRCADGVRVLADSAVIWEGQDRVQLYGSVKFRDAETELEADRAYYFSRDGQLNAWQNVVVRDLVNGAVITGEELRLYRASEFRTTDRMTIQGGTPHATIQLIRGIEQPDSLPEVDATEPERDTTEAPPMPTAEAEPVPPTEDASSDTVASVEVMVPAEGEAEALVPTTDFTVSDSIPPVVTDTLTYDVDAERFILEGRRFFRAAGRVVVHRDSLEAFGDSLDFDQQDGMLSLFENARVEDPKFTLTATVVSLMTPQGGQEEILARESAELLAEAVELSAPSIRMFVENGALSRLVAFRSLPQLSKPSSEVALLGLSEGDIARLNELQGAIVPTPEPAQDTAETAEELPLPTAVADNFTLWADSIEVLSPDQELRQVIAIGRARGETVEDDEGTPDEGTPSDSPDLLAQDWIEGDTIVADFEPSPTNPDSETSTGQARLRQLTAIGTGRSLYRMAPSDTTLAGSEGRRALHYVIADQIRIFFAQGDIHRMEVEGQTEGYHLEPRPTFAPAVDTANVEGQIQGEVADSIPLILPDTNSVAQHRVVPGLRPSTARPRFLQWLSSMLAPPARMPEPTPTVLLIESGRLHER